MTPDAPVIIPDFRGEKWAKHARCHVYHDGLPVWVSRSRMWYVTDNKWEPVREGVEYRRYHIGLFNAKRIESRLKGGLYALIGPTVNGNPYDVDIHLLIKQFSVEAVSSPLTPDGIKAYFEQSPVYGLTWKGTRGRIVKATREQFGLPWPDYELLALIQSKGIAQ